jgi:hypothetical protein
LLVGRLHPVAALALALGGAIYLSGCGTAPPPTEQSVQHSAQPSAQARATRPTPAPAPTAQPSLISPTPTAAQPAGPPSELGETWSSPIRLPGVEATPGSVRAFASDGKRLVAVGTLFSTAGPSRAAVWSSDDGEQWTMVATDSDFEDVTLHTVTASGPGFVAAGHAGKQVLPDVPRPGWKATVWSSTDGSAWTRVPDTSDFADAVIADLAAGRSGMVAVGFSQQAAGTLPSADCLHAISWTSADGLTWTRAPADPALGCAQMTQIVAGGPGYVAGGTISAGSRDESSTPRAQMWVSEDGLAWTPVDGPADATRLFDMAAGPDGLIAVGQTMAGAVGVWRSDDGTSWTPVAGAEFGQARGSEQGSAALAWEHGFLVAGSGGDAWRPAARVWTSPDGQIWHEVQSKALKRAAPIVGFAVHRGRIVAVGGGGFDLVAWVSPARGAEPTAEPALDVDLSPPAALEPRARPVDVVAGNGIVLAVGDMSAGSADGVLSGAAWLSEDDGRSWSAVDTDAFDGASLAAATWTGSSFVVAGSENKQDQIAPLAWTSADGRHWIRTMIEPPVDYYSYRWSIIDDVAAGGTRIVVAGNQQGGETRTCPDGQPALGAGPIAWASADGTGWQRVVDPALDCGRLVSLAASDTAFVGVGSETLSADDGLPASPSALAWVSADGSDWELVDGLSDLVEGGLAAVAAGPGGFVTSAGPNRLPIKALFLHSTDGHTWERAHYSAPIEPGGENIRSFAASPGGYLAVGYVGLGPDVQVSAAWSSSDGRSWVRIVGDATEPTAVMRESFVSAAWTGSSFIALGYRDDQLMAWRMEPTR